MIAYLKILRPWNMKVRAANTHCTSESAIRNGIINKKHRIAKSSSMFCQSRKYSKSTSCVLCQKKMIRKLNTDLPNADILSLFRQTTCSASAFIHYNTNVKYIAIVIRGNLSKKMIRRLNMSSSSSFSSSSNGIPQNWG